MEPDRNSIDASRHQQLQAEDSTDSAHPTGKAIGLLVFTTLLIVALAAISTFY